MKTRRTLLTSALVASFVFGATAPTLAADAHQHGAATPTKLVLDHGKKWATDEPLRRNMAAIRSAIAAKQAGIHKGTLASADYMALGTLVETHVAAIVGECKLAPAADANLHLVIADLLAGAEAMKGKSTLTPAAGAERTVRALNQYGRYFDHPGWKPLA